MRFAVRSCGTCSVEQIDTVNYEYIMRIYIYRERERKKFSHNKGKKTTMSEQKKKNIETCKFISLFSSMAFKMLEAEIEIERDSMKWKIRYPSNTYTANTRTHRNNKWNRNSRRCSSRHKTHKIHFARVPEEWNFGRRLY